MAETTDARKLPPCEDKVRLGFPSGDAKQEEVRNRSNSEQKPTPNLLG